ncbi:MAG TPA: hypothetical protein VE974_01405 [Thermoanaerobaculia bacterium]|nr:hypothetical protein [Thermoanaerobaculia bacterium]
MQVLMIARVAAIVSLIVLGMFYETPASAQHIWVANAGEDTVSKIDINATVNHEVARYRTWFGSSTSPIHAAWSGPAPSRIVVDPSGNAYVLNRFFDPNHRPVLLKILASGLGPTSTSSAALPLIDTDGDNVLDPGELQDKRVAWAVEIGDPADKGSWGRALCIDPNGALWVGLYRTRRYFKVSAATGQVLAGPILTDKGALQHTPYGCAVDANGMLWSASNGVTVAQIDTKPTAPVLVDVLSHQSVGTNYAVSLLTGCDVRSKIYFSDQASHTYIVYEPGVGFQNASSTSVPQFAALAVAVDLDGNIISGATTGRVVKSRPNGTVVWDTNTLPAGPTVGTSDLRGLIVDANNDVWAVHRTNNRLVRYNGASGKHNPLTDVVSVGESPYTYSNVAAPTCPCARVGEQSIVCERENGGIGLYSWSFSYTNHSPFSAPVTSIELSSGTPGTTVVSPVSPYHLPIPVGPGEQGSLSGTLSVTNPKPGDRVCMNVRLLGGEGPSAWCCPEQRVCFTLPECRQCIDVRAVFKCRPDGTRYLELTVTNNGPTAGQSVQIVSTTAGVTFTPSFTQIALPPNTPITLPPILVSGAAPGQTINLTVSLNGATDVSTGTYSFCCTASVTVTVPKKACVKGEPVDLPLEIPKSPK